MRSYGAITSSPAGLEHEGDASPLAAEAGRDTEAEPVQSTWKQNLKHFFHRNFGLFLVFMAQTCGSVMSTAAKLLVNGYDTKFHALHIILIRMSCTTVLSCLYIWWHKIPRPQGVTGLLVLRGTSGFVGLFGLYYSLSWLEFSDATVITFIVPTITALVCFLWLREPYTVKEASAGLIAFAGVLLVARPPWLFPDSSVAPSSHQVEKLKDPNDDGLTFLALGMPVGNTSATPISAHQRTVAILLAILGACGAAMAYATIRVIGKRAHSLISVTYFAFIASTGSALIIFLHPDITFTMPENLSQWGLIAIIGFAGFLLQFLLTEGLQREKAGRATNLTYLQLVFALIIERTVWGTTPPLESFMGAILIIGAAIWVSLQKNTNGPEKKTVKFADEERSLLDDENSDGTNRTRDE